MSDQKPLVLITNDDGIGASGLYNLVKTVLPICRPLVVAPLHPQSGMSHAITIREPLRIKRVDFFDLPDVEAYTCNGTPVDCVKIGRHVIARNLSIALTLSGINHGANSSVSFWYSGTMAAAMESTLGGIQSIGFSLCDYSHQAHFDHTFQFITEIVEKVLNTPLPPDTALNVNFPPVGLAPLKGVRVTRQSRARWSEDFTKRLDPNNDEYFWLTGKFEYLDSGTDTDEYALEHGYVSVTPVHTDATNHKALEVMRSHFHNEIL